MTPPNDAPMPDKLMSERDIVSTIIKEMVCRATAVGRRKDFEFQATMGIVEHTVHETLKYTRSPRTPAAKAEAQRALAIVKNSATFEDVKEFQPEVFSMILALLERECGI